MLALRTVLARAALAPHDVEVVQDWETKVLQAHMDNLGHADASKEGPIASEVLCGGTCLENEGVALCFAADEAKRGI